MCTSGLTRASLGSAVGISCTTRSRWPLTAGWKTLRMRPDSSEPWERCRLVSLTRSRWPLVAAVIQPFFEMHPTVVLAQFPMSDKKRAHTSPHAQTHIHIYIYTCRSRFFHNSCIDTNLVTAHHSVRCIVSSLVLSKKINLSVGCGFSSSQSFHSSTKQ